MFTFVQMHTDTQVDEHAKREREKERKRERVSEWGIEWCQNQTECHFDFRRKSFEFKR